MNTGYGIYKFRVLGVDFTINKILSYNIITASLTFFYFVFIYFLFKLITNYLDYSLLQASVSAVLISVITIIPVRDVIQEIVNKLFSKTKYDFQDVLIEASAPFYVPTTIDKLLKLSIRILIRRMRLLGCAIAIFDEEKEKFIIKAADGEVSRYEGATFSTNYPVIDFLKQKGIPFSNDMIISQLKKRTLDLKEKSYFKSINTAMTELNTRLAVPILWHKELIGVILLGSQVSGDHFSTEDTELLTTIANEAAIAVKNAMLFDSIKKRSDQINSLFLAEKELTHYPDLDKKLSKITESIISFQSAISGCSVYIFDPDTGFLVPNTAIGLKIKPERTVPAEGIVGKSFSEERIITFKPNTVEEKLNSSYIYEIAFPIIADNKAIGAVHILSDSNLDISKEDIELISIFIDQISLSVFVALKKSAISAENDALKDKIKKALIRLEEVQ